MEHRFYLGIDLDDGNAVLPVYELNMREPRRLAWWREASSTDFPVLLAKKNGMGQWLIGEEAGRLAMEQGGGSVEALLTRAFKAGDGFCGRGELSGGELLCLFLKKLLILAGGIGREAAVRRTSWSCVSNSFRAGWWSFLPVLRHGLDFRRRRSRCSTGRNVFIILRAASRVSLCCMTCICLTAGTAGCSAVC